MTRLFILTTLSCLCAAPALACDIAPTETVRVESVSSTTEYVLTDGRVVLLESVGPPRAPADHAGAWPFGADAAAEVAMLLENTSLQIDALPETDRYGRVIALARMSDGEGLQDLLVREGLARVETLPGADRCAAELLRVEEGARRAGRGMWALSAFQVLSTTEAAAFTNDFRIIEGEVQDVAEIRGRVYLNFGPDWRTDFTVTIAPADARAFSQAGHDPLGWAGRRIRVRGWLSWYNGPQIEADHPAQVELLTGTAADEGDTE